MNTTAGTNSDENSVAPWVAAALAAYEAERPGLEVFLARYPADAQCQLRSVLEGADMAAAGGQEMRRQAVVPPAAVVPGRMGPFVVQGEIGRGGMGTVYEAVHIDLKKRVALKVLGKLATAGQVGRFLREARIAGSLHHSNIVPVFDVGQLDGTWYYAMQFIDGRSLDALIKPPSPRTPTIAPAPAGPDGGPHSAQSGAAHGAQLAVSFTPPPGEVIASEIQPASACPDPRYIAGLGLQAAGALAYTHSLPKPVLHRDIKPGNLILDGQGTVWVTDFGLAVRHDDTTLTATGDAPGTPRYMSPEQTRGAELDARTDVYSLGVTLYELLTGQHAFDGDNKAHIIGRVQNDTPPRPRALNPAIPHDLETVVLKAMAKLPQDRYSSGRELADDLRRFLDGKPVRARRIGWAGMAWRWSRRNPAVAGSLAAVLLVFAAGAAVSTYYAWQADRRAHEAMGQRAESRQVAQELVGQAIPLAKKPYAQEESRRLLQTALGHYSRQARHEPVTAEEAWEKGVAHRLAGDIEHALGKYLDAENGYRLAVATFERLAGTPGQAGARAELARCLNNLGNLLADLGRLGEAEVHLLRAASLHEQLANEDGAATHRREAAGTWNNLALVRQKAGRLELAREAYNQARDRQEELAREFPDDAVLRQELAATYMNRAGAREELGDFKGAEADSREAVKHQERLAGEFPKEGMYQRDLAATLNNLGKLLRKAGRLREAETQYLKARDIQDGLVADFSAIPDYRLELSRTQLNLGRLCFDVGRYPGAIAAYDLGLGHLERLVATFPEVPAFVLELARVLNHRGGLLAHLGKRREARAALCRARCLLDELAATHRAPPECRRELARCRHALGLLEESEGRLDDAEREFAGAANEHASLPNDLSGQAESRYELAMIHMALGNTLRKRGRAEPAVAAYQAALRTGEELARRFEDAPAYRYGCALIRSNLGIVYIDLGRWQEAEAHLDWSRTVLRNPGKELYAVVANRQRHGITANSHGVALKRLRRLGPAAEAFAEAAAVQETLACDERAAADLRWNLSQTLLNQGGLLKQLGQYAEARSALERAFTLLSGIVTEPGSKAEYRLDLARVQAQRAELFLRNELFNPPKVRESKAAFDEAMAILGKLVDEFPNRPEFMAELARTCCYAGHQVAARTPADVAAIYRKGIDTLSGLAQRFGAAPMHRYTQACTLTHLGSLLSNMGEAGRAERCFGQAIGMLRDLLKAAVADRNFAESLAVALHNLGSLCAKTGGRSADAERAFDEAIALREELIRRHPDELECRKKLCGTVGAKISLLLRGGRSTQAQRVCRRKLELLQDVLRQSAADPEAHNELAWYLVTCPDLQVRDAREAVRLAQRAIELGPRAKAATGRYWNTLGVAHYRAGDWGKAVRALSESIRLQRHNAFDHFFLAMAHWQQGEKEKARQHFEQAISLTRQPEDDELAGFRREAAALLGLPDERAR